MSDDLDILDDYDSEDDIYMSDDDGIDFSIPNRKGKGKEIETGLEFQSNSPQKLQDLIDHEIRELANVTGLKPEITSILLRYYKWNNEKLVEKFMDSPDEVLRSAGEPDLPLDSTNYHLHVESNHSNNSDSCMVLCDICFDNLEASSLFELRCWHAFCQACWKIYITDKIKAEGQSFMKCMREDCPTVVDEVSIITLVDSSTLLRYKELERESYVAAHPNFRFCPFPSCTETVSCSVGSRSKSAFYNFVPTVMCGNSHSFCIGCGLDSDHRPVICNWVHRWLKSAKEDTGTAQWIKANTRECPNCTHSIEKNGGCNRILCRQCQHQFCWMCRKDWVVHGYSDTLCSIWKEPDPDDAMTEATRTLEKWLFYYDRFNNHEMSARLDQELFEATEEKMVEVQKNSNLSWIESKFMQNAVDILTNCRVTLKWSYVMAFYLAQGNTKEIFEDLQANLEKAVEDLSQMLEEPIEEDTVKSLRQRMTDKAVYVQKRHEILLEDTARGLLEGRWEWKESVSG